jgi:hypothetical protein
VNEIAVLSKSKTASIGPDYVQHLSKPTRAPRIERRARVGEYLVDEVFSGCILSGLVACTS